MKILFHYTDYAHTPRRKALNAYGGVGYYRIAKVAECMAAAGHEVRVVGQEIRDFGPNLEAQWDAVFKEYDVLWSTHFADDRVGAAIFYHARKHGKKVVVDIDDNYLDLPPSNKVAAEFAAGKRKRTFLSTVLSLADAVAVSTEPLRDRLVEHFRSSQGMELKTVLVPNMCDPADWDFPIAERPKDRFVIGYTGSHSHGDDLAMVLPAIREVMLRHPHVWFEILGVIGPENALQALRGFPQRLLDRVVLVPATDTFREYPPHLLRLPWHVGIAPLVDCPFSRCKSHIKWMEYAMAEVPTVASRVHPYSHPLCGRETVEDGETGFLCRPGEWAAALERLVADEALRVRVGKEARKRVSERWRYDPALIAANAARALA
jgi:glycosyltransferase involved in cell wall biosynthesis